METPERTVSAPRGAGRVLCGRRCRVVSPGRGLKRPSVPGLVEFIILDWTKRCQERARKGQSEPSGGLMGSPKQYGLHPGKEGLT